jgi:hypothetical protein
MLFLASIKTGEGFSVVGLIFSQLTQSLISVTGNADHRAVGHHVGDDVAGSAAAPRKAISSAAAPVSIIIAQNATMTIQTIISTRGCRMDFQKPITAN